MSLKGDISSISLFEIFQTLAINRRSGSLRVQDHSRKKIIFFSGGKITLLTEGSRPIRVGEILVATGRITRDQLESALEAQRHTDEKLGEILVERHGVRPEAIEEALKEKIREEVFDLFLWDHGLFEFTPDHFDEELAEASGVTDLQFDTQSLLLEAMKFVDDWGRIQAAIPSPATILERSDLAPGENLSPDEKEVLFHLDGMASVDEMMNRTGWSRYNVSLPLYNLLQNGQVRLLDALQHRRRLDEALGRGAWPLAADLVSSALALRPQPDPTPFLRALFGHPGCAADRGAVTLRAELDRDGLWEFWFLLLATRQAGTLRVWDESVRKTVVLTPGKIRISAVSRHEEAFRLGEIVVARNLATQVEVDRALTRQRERGGMLGEILVQSGDLAPGRLAEALALKAAEELLDFLFWRKARLRFDSNVSLGLEGERPSEVDFPDGEGLADLKGRAERLLEILRDVPGPERIFVPTERGRGNLETLAAGHPVRREIGLIDGASPVADILRRSRFQRLQVYELLSRLRREGFIRPLEAVELAAAARHALDGGQARRLRSLQAMAAAEFDASDPVWAEAAQFLSSVPSLHCDDEGNLRGSGGGRPLLEALAAVRDGGRSGTLQVQESDREKRFYLSRREVRMLSTDAHHALRIGQVLIDRGDLDGQGLDEALFHQKRVNRLLGEILVETGVVAPARLEEALVWKLTEELAGVVFWREPRWVFHAHSLPRDLDPPASRRSRVTTVAMDGEALLETILGAGGWDRVLEHMKGYDVLLETPFASERRGRSHFDGRNPLRRVLRRTAADPVRPLEQVAVRIASGSLRAIGEEALAASARRAEAEGDLVQAEACLRSALQVAEDPAAVRETLMRVAFARQRSERTENLTREWVAEAVKVRSLARSLLDKMIPRICEQVVRHASVVRPDFFPASSSRSWEERISRLADQIAARLEAEEMLSGDLERLVREEFSKFLQ